MEIAMENKSFANTKIKVNKIKPKVKEKPVYDFIKRAFDLIVSLVALVIASPFMLIIAILIKLNSKGPVLYISDRVGKNGKAFKFYKFRSMCQDADEIYEDLATINETGGPTFKSKDDPRITKVGKILRKTSLDELPQLFNIIKGDMSIVGPRPPMVREVEEYDQKAMNRLAVKGGLTCYWQVNGRSNIDFNGMVDLDMKYIKERSVWTDIKIILKTVPAVLKGDGAY
jgi:exopolysaccharide biosynthesis polyprenyl glycosylphosphotransferase